MHSEWVRPVDALRRCRDGDIDLIFPTLRTLLALSRFDRSEELLHEVSAGQHDDVPLVVDDGSGERVCLPGDDHDDARRGWRALMSRLDVDIALERSFHESEDVA